MKSTKRIAKTKEEVKSPAAEVPQKAIVNKRVPTDIELQATSLKNEINTFILGSAIVGKLNEKQKELCMATAMSFGLSPLKREIHFVPHEKRDKTGYDVAIVIGYEVYLKRAERSGKLKGWAIEFIRDNGESACRITINRSDWAQPFTNTIYEKEVMQTYWKDGRQVPTPMWAKMPKFMLKKIAIAQSFRWVFPEEVGGLPYIAEELGLGTIENGQLQEEKPEVHTVKATNPQKQKISILLNEKGFTKEQIYKKYKVESLSDLEINVASKIIEGLMKLPNKPELPDVTPKTPENGAIVEESPQSGGLVSADDIAPDIGKIVDVDKVAKEMEKAKAKEREERRPAEKYMIAWIKTVADELVKFKIIDPVFMETVDFINEEEYKDIHNKYVEKLKKEAKK